MKEFTVKQYAEREMVDQRTVRRWVAKGAVETRRTPGGGVRIIERRSSGVLMLTNHDIHGHPTN